MPISSIVMFVILGATVPSVWLTPVSVVFILGILSVLAVPGALAVGTAAFFIVSVLSALAIPGVLAAVTFAFPYFCFFPF